MTLETTFAPGNPRGRNRPRATAACLVLLIAQIGSNPAFAGQVHITDLGVFGGTTGILTEDQSSVATGISANGIVVGTAWGNGHIEGFVYSGGAIHNVGALGVINNPGIPGVLTGVYTYANAVNSAGYVTGSASQNDQLRAFESVNGNISPVAVVPTGRKIDSTGLAINERGSVAGWRNTPDVFNPQYVDQTAFLYYNGKILDISATVPGTDIPADSAAYGLNNNDLVVGDYGLGGIYNHAFSFDPYSGMMTDLGTLGGTTSTATAVNDAGQIVGYSRDANGVQHAFLYSNNQMAAIDGENSWAYGISQDGHVVGQDGASAFVYYGGIVTDLNTLLPSGSGWDLWAAYGVNDAGQIVGDGLLDGHFHAFLIDNAFLPGQPASPSSSGSGYFIGNTASVPYLPGLGAGYSNAVDGPLSDAAAAPEPGTWALLLAGAAAIAVGRVRRA